MSNVFTIALFAWGIYKCVTIARRPEANAKGAYSLAIVLVSLGIFSIASSIALTPGRAGKVVLLDADRMFLFQAGSVCGLLDVVAIVFAILGLREIKRTTRADEFGSTPGRGMAIFTLVLSTLIFILPAAFGVVKGLR